MELKCKVLLSCLLVAIMIFVQEYYVLDEYLSSIQPAKIDTTDRKRSEGRTFFNPLTRAHSKPAINLQNTTKKASRKSAGKWRKKPEVKTAIDSRLIKGKLVLLYTPLFNETPWKGIRNTFQFTRYRNQSCPVTSCSLSYDKRLFRGSDVVIFHARDMPSTFEMNSLHRRRPKGQVWVYFDLENPANIELDTYDFDGMFNWTITYEKNADIYLPYGSYTALKPGEEPLGEHINPSNKDRLAVWTVGNCGSLRDLYVQQLRNHIRVDVFGGCTKYFYQPHLVEKRCPKFTAKCDNLLKRYKFFLSFENGNCVDYVTEKYWGTPLDLGIVPLVLGGADYKKIAIPGSYINVLDFPSVKALADYLLYLDKNDTAYMEYFSWRKTYKVDGYLKTGSFNEHRPWTCELCAKAQDPQHKVYESLNNFRDSTTHCGIHEEKVFEMMDSEGVNSETEQEGDWPWVEETLKEGEEVEDEETESEKLKFS